VFQFALCGGRESPCKFIPGFRIFCWLGNCSLIVYTNFILLAGQHNSSVQKVYVCACIDVGRAALAFK